jgi:hypothetical protein
MCIEEEYEQNNILYDYLFTFIVHGATASSGSGLQDHT